MNEEYLQTIGSIWTARELATDVVSDRQQEATVKRLARLLDRQPPRSLLLTGEPGVGKSTIIELLARRLLYEGWFVFAAGANDLLAGQRYIGDLEQQIKIMLGQLMSRRKVLWVVPRFHELFYAGRHDFSPVSVLDQIWNHIVSGEIIVVGESQPRHYERLVQMRPQLRTGMEVVSVPAMDPSEALALAQQWCQMPSRRDRWRRVDEDSLREASHLATHYLTSRALPGTLFSFLKVAAEHADSAGTSLITLDTLVDSLASLTGLPRIILSDGEAFDLDDVRRFFQSRVVGQTEAVNVLVERIAMLKAGLTDPTRPAGVFLFVGPTGTGKTEIAKALAHYLFGDEKRMIRLDMSEFQTPDAISRILGSPSNVSSSSALVGQIRRTPFAVILLDEFEKAAYNIWDLFLQVFDDGRLTDPGGDTADFRHAIIIMTSNLGASVPVGTRLGFTRESEVFSDNAVSRAVGQAFRPEFINRIDRIVTFRPLSRATVRQILLNELAQIMERRGLRRRQWAIEWEESALDFLMEKGFSSHLGARPMKRAVERYLLAPLAEAIVEHRFPEGDQFLFIRRGKESLTVEFVDPDEPDLNWQERRAIEEEQQARVGQLTLSQIALTPRGQLAEYETLQVHHSELKRSIDEAEWAQRKQALYEQMADSEFWQRPDRFQVLGELEYRDRVEASLASSASLLDRLRGRQKRRLYYPSSSMRHLALRLLAMSHSLEAFGRGQPQDCYLRISLERGGHGQGQLLAQQFFEQLCAMYRQWAEDRGMTWEVLEEADAGPRRELTVAVSGFAAFPLLQNETGLHVWEFPDGPGQTRRIRGRVTVVAQPDSMQEPVTGPDAADAALAQGNLEALEIVRRYCRHPSPLVRDYVKGWRTGRIDTVLAGDFDLFQ